MKKALILKFKPFLSEKIWGSDKIKKMYDQMQIKNPIGEAWIISAIKFKSSICTYPNKFYGKNLYEIFSKNSELFNNYKNEYPHLIKFIDANDDLSIQVHPNNLYAKKNHNCLGKNEWWYFLKTPNKKKIILGHKAKTKQELKTLINKEMWKKLFSYQAVKKDDKVYIPSGTVHALTSGSFVCEVQQSSDITYRLYDYDRKGLDNKPRSLNTKDSINVIYCPQTKEIIKNKTKKEKGYLIANSFFKIIEMNSKTNKIFNINKNINWVEIICLSGKGKINGEEFKKGGAGILTNGFKRICVSGTLKILCVLV